MKQILEAIMAAENAVDPEAELAGIGSLPVPETRICAIDIQCVCISLPTPVIRWLPERRMACR